MDLEREFMELLARIPDRNSTDASDFDFEAWLADAGLAGDTNRPAAAGAGQPQDPPGWAPAAATAAGAPWQQQHLRGISPHAGAAAAQQQHPGSTAGSAVAKRNRQQDRSSHSVGGSPTHIQEELTKSGASSRRFRSRQKALLAGLEAEVTARLAQLAALSSENEHLRLRSAVLEATVESREDQLRLIQQEGPPVFATVPNYEPITSLHHQQQQQGLIATAAAAVAAASASAAAAAASVASSASGAASDSLPCLGAGGSMTDSGTSGSNEPPLQAAAATSGRAEPRPEASQQPPQLQRRCVSCGDLDAAAPAAHSLGGSVVAAAVAAAKAGLPGVTAATVAAAESAAAGQQQQLPRQQQGANADADAPLAWLQSGLVGAGGGASRGNSSTTLRNATAVKKMSSSEVLAMWKQLLQQASEALVVAEAEAAAAAMHGSCAGAAGPAATTAGQQLLDQLAREAAPLMKLVSQLNPASWSEMFGRRLDTGLPVPASERECHWREVVSKLELTQQQVAAVLSMADLYFNSLNKLQADRATLQLRLRQSDAATRQLIKDESVAPATPWLDRLLANLKREHSLRVMLTIFMWDKVFTHLQAAKAAVHSHPLYPDMHAIVSVIRDDAAAAAAQGGAAAAPSGRTNCRRPAAGAY